MLTEVFEFADGDAAHGNGMQRQARVVGYEYSDSQLDQDSCVIVIEDTAYCDGRGSPDYVECVYFHNSLYHNLTIYFMSSKLFAHLDIFKPPPSGSDIPLPLPLSPYEQPKRSTPLQKGPPFHAVPLRELTLRISEPYWILHRGNCEHWFVIDEIRYAFSLLYHSLFNNNHQLQATESAGPTLRLSNHNPTYPYFPSTLSYMYQSPRYTVNNQ